MMSGPVVTALRSEGEELLALCRTLTAEEWAAPSACAGWRVQDVVAHIASHAHGSINPLAMRPARDAESMNEKLVALRRGWSSEQVLAEYETWAGRRLRAVDLLQRSAAGAVRVPMPGLGTHPVRMLGNAFVFDVHLHLRSDILAPNGPIVRPIPETPATTMAVILEWMLAGLPQMCRENLSWVTEPLALELTGPGGGTFSIAPGRRRTLTVTRDDDSTAKTRITTRAIDFEVWSTTRRDWRDYEVTFAGDIAAATRFCDSLDIV